MRQCNVHILLHKIRKLASSAHFFLQATSVYNRVTYTFFVCWLVFFFSCLFCFCFALFFFLFCFSSLLFSFMNQEICTDNNVCVFQSTANLKLQTSPPSVYTGLQLENEQNDRQNGTAIEQHNLHQGKFKSKDV